MRVHHLNQNMCLGQDPESDQWAQQLLHIGCTDVEIELPQHMHYGDSIASLMDAMYSNLLALHPHQHLPDHNFLDHTILSPRNTEVNEINSIFWKLSNYKTRSPIPVQTLSLMESMSISSQKSYILCLLLDFPYTNWNWRMVHLWCCCTTWIPFMDYIMVQD